MISKPEHDRVVWVDVAKGIGIILVVLGHVSKNQSLITWIYSFHMPLFFCIAGWLMQKHCGTVIFGENYILGKLKRLILPFCEYRIILVAYWFLIERHFRELDMGPIWFLPTIFLAYMIVAVLNPYLKNKTKSIEITAISIFVLILIVEIHSLPYSKSAIGIFCYEWVTRGICASTWLLIAICVKQVWEKYKNIQKVYAKHQVIITIIFGAASVFTAFINGDVSLFNLIFGKSFFWYYLSGICGVIFVFGVAKHMGLLNKSLIYLGRKSIVIMAFHEPIKRVFFKCFETASNYLNIGMTYEIVRQTILGSVLLTLVTVILCVTVIYYIDKFKKALPQNKIMDILFSFID